MKTQIITIAVIICILPFVGCHVQKEQEKGLEKFRNGPKELCEAIEKGNIKAVKAIIKKGIDLDLPAKKDEFPLFYAAGSGRPEIARLLIQAGANINIKDSYGDTALHIAIRESNYKVAEILINSGADVNAKIEKGFFPGFRPLHTAVNGKKDIPYLVSLLISKGAEVNSRDAKGKTPLQYAMMNRFSQSEQILLKHEKSPGNIQKSTHFPVLKGPYLGQKPPGMIPEIFAPEVITKASHSVAAFSPEGLEVFYVPWSTLEMETMKQINGVWTRPQTVSFASEYDAENPWFTADGTRMYFTSTRPLELEGLKVKEKFWQENIWYVEREKDGWSEPIPLGPEVNSMDLHWQFSIDDQNNDLFFSVSSGESGGRSDIYKSVLSDGQYTNPVKLSEAINTQGDEATPFIAPNGSYLIFARKPGADTTADLYISFRNQDGSWTDAVNLGSNINSQAHEVCPVVTRDGKYFFFISMKSGKPQIYWVDAKIMEELKPKELK
jgi:hypothetical protein